MRKCGTSEVSEQLIPMNPFVVVCLITFSTLVPKQLQTTPQTGSGASCLI